MYPAVSLVVRYHPPLITAIGVLPPTASASASAPAFNPTALANLATLGGETLVFQGLYFGPSTPALPVTAVGRSGAGASVVSAEGCTVTPLLRTPSGLGPVPDLDEVRCTSPPGVGVGYVWVLTVAGQASPPSNTSTSYAPPAITGLAVSGLGSVAGDVILVPTVGGATVTVRGTGLGASLSLLSVFWNGRPVAGVVLTQVDSVLTFPSPAGGGGNAVVSVEVGGQRTAVFAGTADPLALR